MAEILLYTGLALLTPSVYGAYRALKVKWHKWAIQGLRMHTLHMEGETANE